MERERNENPIFRWMIIKMILDAMGDVSDAVGQVVHLADELDRMMKSEA
jgi:hypothetical protein